jgi:D-alanyl-D-alanine carboxypeptidase
MYRFQKYSCPAILTILLLTTLPVASQSVDNLPPELRSQVDRIAAQVLEATGVPSASVAVVEHGKLVYTHAYGSGAHGHRRFSCHPCHARRCATPSGRSRSNLPQTAIHAFAGQEGKLSLDDPVGKYIPGLTRGNEVTIREILSHTSGYQDYWPEDYVMTPMLKAQKLHSRSSTRGAKKPLDFEPGTQWQYSNTNFVIAGRIVEVVSGERYWDFLTEHIFRPLGMTSVWNSDQHPLAQVDATGYYRHALCPLRPAPEEGAGWMFAAGELAMTAHDLAIWDESLLAQSLLSSESYKRMFTEVKLKNGEGTHYGLGVDVRDRNGHRSIEHSGEVSGFVSENEVFIDDGAAVAVLTNQDAVNAAGTIAHLAAPLVASFTLAPAEQQALDIYRGLQQGHIDRSLLAPNLNDYFTAQAIADFQSSLAPLGEPLSLRQTRQALRGGMTFRAFEIVYPGKRLELTTYTYPDGKLEQYLIAPED